MTANWLILTKVHMAGVTGINRLRYSQNKNEKRKSGLVIGVCALCALVLLAFVCVYAVAFAEMGLGGYLISLSFALAALITLTFSLMRGAHILFAIKDFDSLASLPLKKSDILISRLIVSYLVNMAFCAVVIIPCAVVAFVYNGFNAGIAAYALLGLLVCPVIPLVIADVFGTLIMAVTMNFRYKAVLQTALYAILLVAIMACSFLISSIGDNPTDEIVSAIEGIILYYPPAWLLQQSISGNGFWWALVLLGASLAVAAAFIGVLSVVYFKINAKLVSNSDNGKFDAKRIKAGAPFAALYKNEMSRLVSSPAYLLNSTAGLILLIILSVGTIFFNPVDLIVSAGDADAAMISEIKYTFCAVVAFSVGLTIPSSAALSLEGSRRWIAFTLPVSPLKILLAKAFVGLSLSGTVGVACSAILTITLGMDALQACLMFGTVISFSLFSSFFGIFINSKLPKYDWTNEGQVVKRGAASTICTFAGMLPPLAVLMFGSMLPVSIAYLILGMDALYLIASVICLVLISKTKLQDK